MSDSKELLVPVASNGIKIDPELVKANPEAYIPRKNVIRCIKCGQYGHMSTDPDCPLSSRNQLEAEAQERLDPMSGKKHTTQLDPLTGIKYKKVALPRQSKYDIIPEPEVEKDPIEEAIKDFPEEDRELLLKLVKEDMNKDKSHKHKHHHHHKHKHSKHKSRSKSPSSSSSSSNSSSSSPSQSQSSKSRSRSSSRHKHHHKKDKKHKHHH